MSFLFFSSFSLSTRVEGMDRIMDKYHRKADISYLSVWYGRMDELFVVSLPAGISP